MATIFDNKPATAYTPVQEDAAIHNARIKERYEQLKNAEANQLAESISEAEKRSYAPPRASVGTLAPERPARTEYPAYTAPAREETDAAAFVHTKVDSPLFTPETLDRTIGRETYDFVPVETPDMSAVSLQAANMQRAEAAMAQAPVTALPAAAVNAAPREEAYGLSAFAVKMIAAFAALVIVLLTVIGINSGIIRQKSIKLNALEAEKATLAQRNAQVEQQIEEATSYEKIEQFAKEHGWILQEK